MFWSVRSEWQISVSCVLNKKGQDELPVFLLFFYNYIQATIPQASHHPLTSFITTSSFAVKVSFKGWLASK